RERRHPSSERLGSAGLSQSDLWPPAAPPGRLHGGPGKPRRRHPESEGARQLGGVLFRSERQDTRASTFGSGGRADAGHGRGLGELRQSIRAGSEMAKKTGADPWLFSFREAWLRTVVLDFDGARRLCETLTRTTREHRLGQPRTIARFAAGYEGLSQGQFDV